MAEDNIFRKAFSHYVKELNIPNIAISLQKCDFEKIRKAHDSIHEFMLVPTHLIGSNEDFQAKLAFLIYHSETFDQAHRSLLELLSGYYNAAYTLLRNTLELILKGAFWECMAHKKYRDKAEFIRKKKVKVENRKISLVDWLNELIKQKPSIENELERTSAGIYDKISPLFEDVTLRKKIIPSVRSIVEQLRDWKIFDPIQDPVKYVYDFNYGELSADVHVAPDKTNIGKRLLAGEELFEIEVIPDELNGYAEALLRVMDIGIVIELNILEDIIIKNEESKKWLDERLVAITELELNYAATKIVEMTKK